MKKDDVVLVAVAIDDSQATIYKKLLEDQGIRAMLTDFDDLVVGDEVIPGKTIPNVKIHVLVKDAKAAEELIKDYENKKITKVTSKSGQHLIFRCPNCKKYVMFPFRDAGTSQLCPECSKIIELPD
ncbi:MAG: hypothetical protein ACYTHM_20310 [Planctomycetota bacterium]|jgi:predicted Zn-ribbon and HTH transcriptional regulator